uniref:Uncharacterized protein n=1 Tax=Peronospora matthiolae TaxID=2874970 RepID=A0AAV1U1S5_9STRA
MPSLRSQSVLKPSLALWSTRGVGMGEYFGGWLAALLFWRRVEESQTANQRRAHRNDPNSDTWGLGSRIGL